MNARRIAATVVALVAVLGSAGCGSHKAAVTPQRLIGLFRISPGHCTVKDGRPTGSYLTVISAAANKLATNPDGGCINPSYTPLKPGTDGGLVTGRFQPEPDPAFDSRRNSRSDRIIVPTAFDRFKFGFATNSRDEQDASSGEPAYPAPQAIATGSSLAVDLRSLVVGYAGRANSTCAASYGLGCWELGSKSAGGTYNPTTHRFVIDWFAGTSFTPKGDSVEVHLEGTFVPAAT